MDYYQAIDRALLGTKPIEHNGRRLDFKSPIWIVTAGGRELVRTPSLRRAALLLVHPSQPANNGVKL